MRSRLMLFTSPNEVPPSPRDALEHPRRRARGSLPKLCPSTRSPPLTRERKRSRLLACSLRGCDVVPDRFSKSATSSFSLLRIALIYLAVVGVAAFRFAGGTQSVDFWF